VGAWARISSAALAFTNNTQYLANGRSKHTMQSDHHIARFMLKLIMLFVSLKGYNWPGQFDLKLHFSIFRMCSTVIFHRNAFSYKQDANKIQNSEIAIRFEMIVAMNTGSAGNN
jgi:hypothetical protein